VEELTKKGGRRGTNKKQVCKKKREGPGPKAKEGGGFDQDFPNLESRKGGKIGKKLRV